MKLNVILMAIAALGVSAFASAEKVYLPDYLETGLVKICKTAAKDQLMPMAKTIKEYYLTNKVVALNVVCNGQDIVSFAQSYGAERTTARLSHSIGRVEVTDIAQANHHKYDVTVDMSQ